MRREARNMLRHSLTTIGAAAMVYYVVAGRPWQLRWGATDEEVQRRLPGDEFVRRPRILSTRAVTIGAPAEAVWPWLVQIGFRRAGWYSYDVLEAALGVGEFQGGHSARRIIPELQQLKVGDTILTDPAGGFTVAAIEPERAVVLRARIDTAGRHGSLDAPLLGTQFDASWAFVLDQVGDGVTRLIARFRADFVFGLETQLFARLLLEPAAFIMERRMLLGIKERAEA